MSLVDNSVYKLSSSDPITFYVYQEVFLRGNLDDLLVINTAVKLIGTVRSIFHFISFHF